MDKHKHSAKKDGFPPVLYNAGPGYLGFIKRESEKEREKENEKAPTEQEAFKRDEFLRSFHRLGSSN